MTRNQYSWEIDIRRLQNLMDTSNSDAERDAIQNLLTKEETKLRSEQSDDGPDRQPELNKPADLEP
jgi:hypothetical protein